MASSQSRKKVDLMRAPARCCDTLPTVIRTCWRSGFATWLLALAGASLPASALSAEAARRPNIVVIVADDQGYSDLGVQGGQDIPTPHIDSLAKNGVRCTSGYVSGPYCSPTRAGLMTGRYQQRFGHEFNPGPPSERNRQIGLSLQEKTMPARLRAAGYKTGMVGKWHLGHAPEFHPQSRGFDEYFGFLGGAHSYFEATDGADPILRGREPAGEQGYLTDAFGREAVAFIDRHKQQPFFLYLAFNAVHTPLHATDERLARFANIEGTLRKTYAAMTAAMDDAVGLVLKKLADERLTERTLIFYVSDNGGPPVNGSNNLPLRGYKATTWEGGVRVPFFVQWTGTIPAGKVYDQPVIQLDILPTALAAAGAPDAADPQFDGVNLLPFLCGDKTDPPHSALYWRFGEQWAIRMGSWKLTYARLENQLGLYDLSQDIGERHDLQSQHPEKVAELQAAWKKWDATLVEPTWGPPRALVPGKKAAKKKSN